MDESAFVKCEALKLQDEDKEEDGVDPLPPNPPIEIVMAGPSTDTRELIDGIKCEIVSIFFSLQK